MKFASRNDLEIAIKHQVRENVFNAFRKVDRKIFVPENYQRYAYLDKPITLDVNSTISQPTLVVEMIDVLALKGSEKVLEIGTGSGYSSALLSFCAKEVFTIENNKRLANSARKRLKKLGFKNITIHLGDGAKGIPEKAPFDMIILTAAVTEVPPDLADQLTENGKMLLPLEGEQSDMQVLILMIKHNAKFMEKEIMPVRFVPLT